MTAAKVPWACLTAGCDESGETSGGEGGGDVKHVAASQHITSTGTDAAVLSRMDAIRLCSQCGEEPGAMLKLGTEDVWCLTCLDEAADTALRDRMEALADEFDAKGRRGSAHFGADIGDTIRLWVERDPRIASRSGREQTS